MRTVRTKPATILEPYKVQVHHVSSGAPKGVKKNKAPWIQEQHPSQCVDAVFHSSNITAGGECKPVVLTILKPAG
jgi:hypothetical protein